MERKKQKGTMPAQLTYRPLPPDVRLGFSDIDDIGVFARKDIEQGFSLYNHAYGTWKKDVAKNLPKYYLERLWCNFQRPNDFNPPHSHGGALSFIIFLQIPEDLKDENEAYKGKSAGPGGVTFLYGDGDSYAINSHSFFPEERDMFIFPAWVKHWVYPYQSDCTRISVSGNVIDSMKLNQMETQ